MRCRSPIRTALGGLLLLCVLAVPAAGQDAQAPPRDPVPEPPAVGARQEALLPEDTGEAPRLPEGEAPGAPAVAAVEVRSDVPLSPQDLAEVRQLVVLAPGEPLNEERVGRTLRNLQASGLASRVDVYSRPAVSEGAVVAVVVLRGNVIVEAVRVEGDTGAVDRGRLEEALFQAEGEPLIESRLVRGVYRLQEIFEEEGYFEARVRLAPEIDEARRRSVVVYRVEAGPRATVGSLSFDGDIAPFTPEELRQPLRTAVGEPFRSTQARRDGERLERWLIGKQHRTARVEAPLSSYDREAERVAVTFPLTVGPRLEVAVEGAELERLRKRDLIPFLDDEGYDEALLLLAEQRIREHYQRRGHHDVTVSGREERRDGVLRVILEIDPGPVYELRQVRLEGNQEYSDERLKELMETQPAGALSALPGVRGGRLVDDTLSADLDNLRAFYALEGYVDAEVGPPEVERRDGGLAVTVPIEEGVRQQVVDLTLQGVEALDPEELRGLIPLRAGGPFHPRLLENSLNQIRARYERQGYDSARVSATTSWDDAHTLVDVGIRVLEGLQTVVDQVIVRGNRRTDTEVVRRAVGLDPGEPVSRSRLLEAERSLYRLGIFSRVELDLTPAPLGATTRDVVVRVEEGRVRSLRYGLSAEYNDDLQEWSLGGSVGITHSNLFGRAITLSADARVLSRSEQYRLFADQPTVGGWPVSANYSLFQTQEQRASFEVERRGARVEAIHQTGDRVRYGLAYDYRIVDNRPLEDIAPGDGDLRREDQTLRVAGLVPSVYVDRRDDPINPSRGWTALSQLQYTFPLFNAEAEYVKLFLQYTRYLDVGFGTLALSTRLGGIEPLAPLPADIDDPFVPPQADLPSREVFLAERFFAGGETSHRAYQRDRLGIPFSTCLDGGDPTDPDAVAPDCAATLFPAGDDPLTPAGGNGLALVNVDLRVPIFGPVEGVLFYDSGNVWADWRQIRLRDFRSGAGVEIRYASPVGPLRVGVGIPLDPIEGTDEQVFFLSLGAPF